MFRADIGVTHGKVTAIGCGLTGVQTLEANGMLVMPGGVDTRCHIEQLRAPGSDADPVVRDTTRQVTISKAVVQHVIDYTPYEGLVVTGWPVATIRRGEVVMRDGKAQAESGSGQFLTRDPYEMIRPTGRIPNGFDTTAFPV